MDNKSFFNEIRKIVKEEIELAFKEKNKKEVTEVDFNRQIKEFQKMQIEAKNKKSPASISELLSETRNDMNNKTIKTTDDQWKTINFSSNDVNKFYKNENLNFNGTVESALTRNYSELMKAIKDKKK